MIKRVGSVRFQASTSLKTQAGIATSEANEVADACEYRSSENRGAGSCAESHGVRVATSQELSFRAVLSYVEYS